jgi:hypothetical protein
MIEDTGIQLTIGELELAVPNTNVLDGPPIESWKRHAMSPRLLA